MRFSASEMVELPEEKRRSGRGKGGGKGRFGLEVGFLRVQFSSCGRPGTSSTMRRSGLLALQHGGDLFSPRCS
jgi:hypothetical protein